MNPQPALCSREVSVAGSRFGLIHFSPSGRNTKAYSPWKDGGVCVYVCVHVRVCVYKEEEMSSDFISGLSG